MLPHTEQHLSLAPLSHTCNYIHTYVPSYMHAYIHTCIHTYIHYIHYITYIHTILHAYMHTYIHTHINTYIHTYIPFYMHTCIHTYINTYIHTCIPSILPSRSFTTSFVFPSFPVPAKTIEAHFRKKLTCGVIRSFNFAYEGVLAPMKDRVFRKQSPTKEVFEHIDIPKK